MASKEERMMQFHAISPHSHLFHGLVEAKHSNDGLGHGRDDFGASGGADHKFELKAAKFDLMDLRTWVARGKGKKKPTFPVSVS
jgi:hypothetical protein